MRIYNDVEVELLNVLREAENDAINGKIAPVEETFKKLKEELQNKELKSN